MTNHTELKRLAEAATAGPWYVQYGDDASHRCMTAISTRNKRLNNQGCFTESELESLVAITLHQSYPWVDPDCVNDDNNSNYIAAVSPDVVLSMIAEIERHRCGTEVLQRLHDEDMAERNKLCTQNQALLEALKTLYVKLTPQVNGADEHCYLIGMRKQVSHAEMIKVVAAIKLAEGEDV